MKDFKQQSGPQKCAPLFSTLTVVNQYVTNFYTFYVIVASYNKEVENVKQQQWEDRHHHQNSGLTENSSNDLYGLWDNLYLF